MTMTVYNKLRKLLTPSERRQLVTLLFLMFIGMILEMIGIGLVIPAIALMTKPDLAKSYPILQPMLTFFGNPTQAQLVIGGMLALVGLYLIKTVFLIFMVWKQNRFIAGVQSALSCRLFTGYLHQPWSFHLQRNSAQLILNVTNEVNIFIGTALQPGMLVLTEGLVLFGVTILLFTVEPVGSFIVVSTMGLAAWGFQRVIRNHLLSWGKARQYHEGLRIQHLQQGLGGAKDVKLLGRENEFIAQYQQHNISSTSVSQRQKTLMEMPRIWLELLAVAGLAALVLVMLGQGKSLDSLLPTMGLFTAAAFRLLPSANRVLGAIQSLRYGLPVINTLEQEIALLSDEKLPERKGLLPFKHQLTLEQVDYHYSKAENKALNNLTISIPCGSSVGFIGSSGAGKSTLVDTILGLLTPVNGYIKIDGVDIQTNLRGWQDQIGYVPQSIYLTDDTLRRNVAFGVSEENIDDAAIARAIKAAQLEDFIESLPEGMNTLVGERGIRLSGGQRQRIGIARALYHDPAVLVLDEATSALDTLTEKGVMEAINALHGKKTLLIVAHRLSTVANCDRLYRMELGKIIEEGNFESVTNTRVAFAK
ncbi:MAG: ABC transporter ATP-binding protein [Legionella sp.]|nr:ABC transporter ATP-binding protein [Legionella sp.]